MQYLAHLDIYEMVAYIFTTEKQMRVLILSRLLCMIVHHMHVRRALRLLVQSLEECPRTREQRHCVRDSSTRATYS